MTNNETLPSMDGIEDKVQRIVSKLSFIEKWQNHKKIDVHTHQLVEDTLINNAYRWTSRGRESRSETLDYAKKVIGDAFNFGCLLLKQSNSICKMFGVLVMSKIRSSKKGIKTLLKTYQTDEMYVSTVETFLLTLDTKLTAIVTSYPDLETNMAKLEAQSTHQDNTPSTNEIFFGTPPLKGASLPTSKAIDDENELEI